MKSVKTGAVSGWAVWISIIVVLSLCLLPSFFIIGSVTPPTQSTIRTAGKFLCPAGSTPENYVHEWGVDRLKAYEIHCEDANGDVVEMISTEYAFLLEGIFVLAGLIIAVGLLFALAVPLRASITKFLGRQQAS